MWARDRRWRERSLAQGNRRVARGMPQDGGGVTIKAKQRADGVRYQVYGKRNGRKVYVGTYDTENEAKQADFSYRTAPIGSAVSFRVIAIYANGVEREISAFDVAKECPERGYAR